MTLNADDRSAAIRRVLIVLAARSWDVARESAHFGDADIASATPFRTTIDEMIEQQWVEQVCFSSDPQPYRLTLEGWFRAQLAAGQFDSDDFNARRGRVLAAIKSAVAGRHDGALRDLLTSPRKRTFRTTGC